MASPDKLLFHNTHAMAGTGPCANRDSWAGGKGSKMPTAHSDVRSCSCGRAVSKDQAGAHNALQAMWLVVGLLLCICAAGCARKTDLGNPLFCPSSSILAYVAQTHDVLSSGEASGAQTAHVCWFNVNDPKRVNSLRIASVNASWDDVSLSRRIHLAFSPDSRHLAVISPSGLDLIALDTAKRRTLSRWGETVTSMVWLSAKKIAYVAHTHQRGKRRETSDRTFWQHKVGGPGGARAVIHREKRAVTGVGCRPAWPLEHWSPDGRFVIFADRYFDGQFKLLNVQTNKTRLVGKCNKLAALVAWKPDSSAAACIGGAWPLQAVVVEAGTGKTLEISSRFMQAFGAYPPRAIPGWTADGKFLIVNDISRRGCLVQAEPWKVLRIGMRFFDRGKRQWYSRAGFIYAAPISGRLFVNGGKFGWCLADYAGRLGVLPESDTYMGFPPAVSPDGTWVATKQEHGQPLEAAIAEGCRARRFNKQVPLADELPREPPATGPAQQP